VLGSTPPRRRRRSSFLPTASLDPTTGVLLGVLVRPRPSTRTRIARGSPARRHATDARGRRPLRASAEPTSPNILYGTLGGTGLYPAVAAEQGVAHVFWADGRVIANSTDLFTGRNSRKTAFLPEN